MNQTIETKIDERGRSGVLSGVARPGERFAVERVSPVEIRMRLLVPADVPVIKPVRRNGRLMLPRPVSGQAVRAAIREDRDEHQSA